MRRVDVPLTIRLDRLHFVLQAALGWTTLKRGARQMDTKVRSELVEGDTTLKGDCLDCSEALIGAMRASLLSRNRHSLHRVVRTAGRPNPAVPAKASGRASSVARRSDALASPTTSRTCRYCWRRPRPLDHRRDHPDGWRQLGHERRLVGCWLRCAHQLAPAAALDPLAPLTPRLLVMPLRGCARRHGRSCLLRTE
jgi:hypothetical protein